MEDQDKSTPKKPRLVEDTVPAAMRSALANLPAEVFDQIAEFNVLSCFPEVHSVDYLVLREGGRIFACQSRLTLHEGAVDCFGRSGLFDQKLVNLGDFGPRVMAVVLPSMIFQINELEHLEWFVPRLLARCDDSPIIHVQIPVLPEPEFTDDPEYTDWNSSHEHKVVPHGAMQGARATLIEWVKALAMLGPNLKLYLTFDHFYRDFSAMRSIFVNYGMHERVVGCYLAPELANFPNFKLFRRETLAAVTDAELPQRPMPYNLAKDLADHGCRGFRIRRCQDSEAVKE